MSLSTSINGPCGFCGREGHASVVCPALETSHQKKVRAGQRGGKSPRARLAWTYNQLKGRIARLQKQVVNVCEHIELAADANVCDNLDVKQHLKGTLGEFERKLAKMTQELRKELDEYARTAWEFKV